MRRPPSLGLVRAFLLTAAALSTAAPALGRCAAAGVRATAEPAASDSAATRSAGVSSPGPAAASDVVAGGGAHASPEPRVYFGSSRHLRVVPPRVSMAPNIDGLLNDEVWAQAAVLDSFTQGRPIEAVPDSLGTRCYVMYDERNLYVGFRCPDDPHGVQSPVTPRDESWRGDFACVNIDAYHDHQRSQFFCVNPQGVQMDGMDAEGVDSDLAPDFLYTSRARRVEHGWEVEMAIPFTSLRFSPRDSVTFGFNASRQIKRENSEVFWAPVTRNINSYHAQMGALAGMTGVSPGRNLQVNPTLTGTRQGERAGPDLAYQDDQRFGLGLKYGVTSGVTADLAVTPDFSQVEADAGVIDVNERFAIYYPEKRPFFLEGSDFFRSPINLVYTRRIVDPRVGTKLTGKVGRTALGVIAASDRFDGEPIDGLTNARNPYFDHDARYGIVRLQRDVLENSYLGLLGGTREQLDTYNRGLGVDGRLSILKRYTLSFQRVQSWSRERDFRGALTAADSVAFGGDVPTALSGTGRMRSGDASWLELKSNAKHLDASGSVLDISRDFSADMGFVNRTDQIAGVAVVAPHVISKGNTWWTSVEPNLRFERTYDHGATRHVGRRTDELLQPQVVLVFPRNTWVGGGYRRRFTAFQGQRFDGQDQVQVWFGSERWESVRGGLLVSGGKNVLFEEAVPGRFVYLEGWSDLRLTDQLDASINLVAERDRRRDGTRFVDQVIPRVRVSYQFTRELALRHIVELRSERRFDTAGVASGESRTLSLDWLASYVLRPGTVAYLGYGALLTGPSAHFLKTERNSVFAKVSYLWQG